MLAKEGAGGLGAALKRGLNSTSFKVKSKMLALAKAFLWAVEGLSWDWREEKVGFGRMMVETMRCFMGGYRDSKIHYTSVLNLGLAM